MVPFSMRSFSCMPFSIASSSRRASGTLFRWKICRSEVELLTVSILMRAGFLFRFEQNGVHRRGRIAAGGPRLQGLGPADFSAIGGDRCIVGHVLRLERRDRKATIAEQPAKPCHD